MWLGCPLSFAFRCSEFETKLESYNKELEGFRKREVMSTEEMKNNVEKLNELSKNLDQALMEFEVWGLGVWGWRLKWLSFPVASASWFCVFLTPRVRWIVLIGELTSFFIGAFNYLFPQPYIIPAFLLVIEDTEKKVQ